MSRVPTLRPPRKIDVVRMALQALVLLGRNWKAFALACIIPLIGTLVIREFMVGLNAHPDIVDRRVGMVLWWGAYFVYLVVLPSMFIVGCLRILFGGNGPPRPFGITFDGWERRFLVILIVLRVIIHFRSSIVFGIWANDTSPDHIVGELSVWFFWFIHLALEAPLLLAMVYVADANARWKSVVKKVWRTLPGNGLRLVALSILVHVCMDFWVYPVSAYFIFGGEESAIYREIVFVTRYFFGWAATALVAYLAFLFFHPNTLPEESMTVRAYGGAGPGGGQGTGGHGTGGHGTGGQGSNPGGGGNV